MGDSLDAYQYASHLRSRWRFVALACAVAGLLSFAVSLLLPKKYTATARLVIDPPAGSDPRARAAVSPMYLESLKSYEHLASSESLFLGAVERFKLRERAGAKSVETLKRSILKVGVLRNPKILEFGAGLPDPRRAHELVLCLAEQTVKLNRTVNRELEGVRAALRVARVRAERLRKQAAGLEREVARKQALLSERAVRRDMLTARRGAAQADVAAFEQRVREFRGAVASRDD